MSFAIHILLHILLIVGVTLSAVATLLWVLTKVINLLRKRPPAIERFYQLKSRGDIAKAAELGLLSTTSLWIPRSEHEHEWNIRASEADEQMLQALQELAPFFGDSFEHRLKRFAEALQARRLLLNDWSEEKIITDKEYRSKWDETATAAIREEHEMLRALSRVNREA